MSFLMSFFHAGRAWPLRQGRTPILCSGLLGVIAALGCGGEGSVTRDRGAAPGPGGGATALEAMNAQWQPPAESDPSSPVGRFGALRVEGSALVDQAGDPVQLKGVSTMW